MVLIVWCSQDSAGYPQKTVTLMYPAGNQTRTAEFQVRKMANSRSVVTTELESEELPVSSKRSSEENVAVAKRRRVSGAEELNDAEFRDVAMDHTSTSEPSKGPAWVNKFQILETEEGEISEGEVKDIVVERPEKTCCCSHSQELEVVKLELAKVRKESKSRAEEIKSLQKLVASLSRREGLA